MEDSIKYKLQQVKLFLESTFGYEINYFEKSDEMPFDTLTFSIHPDSQKNQRLASINIYSIDDVGVDNIHITQVYFNLNLFANSQVEQDFVLNYNYKIPLGMFGVNKENQEVYFRYSAGMPRFETSTKEYWQELMSILYLLIDNIEQEFRKITNLETE